MKKFITLILALTMVLAMFAGCVSEDAADTTTAATTEAATETATEATTEATEVITEETTEPQAAASEGALQILENIWNDYDDSEKFAVIGGNMENPVDGAPGNYDLAYAENMTYNLLVPAERIADVAEAASMIHMMNANTFTCGAFRLAEGVDVADFAAAMEAAVMGNQWMCGFPDTLVIASFDESYVLVAFGVNDAMDPFQTHLAAVYPEAQMLYVETIG